MPPKFDVICDMAISIYGYLQLEFNTTDERPHNPHPIDDFQIIPLSVEDDGDYSAKIEARYRIDLSRRGRLFHPLLAGRRASLLPAHKYARL